jgi:hypothetical protein
MDGEERVNHAPDPTSGDTEVSEIMDIVRDALYNLRVNLFNDSSIYEIHDFAHAGYTPPFLVDDEYGMMLSLFTESFGFLLRGDVDDAIVDSDVNELLRHGAYTITSSCPICLCDDDLNAVLTYETLSRILGRKSVAVISGMLDPPCLQLKCGHSFHLECLRPWVAKRGVTLSCPMCRDMSIIGG